MMRAARAPSPARKRTSVTQVDPRRAFLGFEVVKHLVLVTLSSVDISFSPQNVVYSGLGCPIVRFPAHLTNYSSTLSRAGAPAAGGAGLPALTALLCLTSAPTISP